MSGPTPFCLKGSVVCAGVDWESQASHLPAPAPWAQGDGSAPWWAVTSRSASAVCGGITSQGQGDSTVAWPKAGTV